LETVVGLKHEHEEGGQAHDIGPVKSLVEKLRGSKKRRRGGGGYIQPAARYESLNDVFSRTWRESEHPRYAASAFILSTPADGKVFGDFLRHIDEIDRVTGERIVVFAPHIAGADAESWSKERTFEALKSVAVGDGGVEAYGSLSPEIRKWLESQTSETYAFAEKIRLKLADLPCIVFFEDLTAADQYVRWSLKGAASAAIIHDLRRIVDAVEAAKARDETLSALQVIRTLKRRGAGLKTWNGIVITLPIVLNVLTVIDELKKALSR
jgi:hypothetical protein